MRKAPTGHGARITQMMRYKERYDNDEKFRQRYVDNAKKYYSIRKKKVNNSCPVCQTLICEVSRACNKHRRIVIKIEGGGN